VSTPDTTVVIAESPLSPVCATFDHPSCDVERIERVRVVVRLDEERLRTYATAATLLNRPESRGPSCCSAREQRYLQLLDELAASQAFDPAVAVSLDANAFGRRG